MLGPGQIASARLTWHGRQQIVTGTLDPGFLITCGRVLIRLRRVQPPLPEDVTDIWVEASALLTPAAAPVGDPSAKISSAGEPPASPLPVADPPPATFVLRSAMYELPTDHTRDYALRTLSVTLSHFIAEYGVGVSLAPGIADTMELSTFIDVPRGLAAKLDAPSPGDPSPAISDGADYLWKFRLATRPSLTKPALWTQAPPPFAAATLGPEDRAHAAHHMSQLPLWLTTRRFWSVFRWHEGRLQHVLQFSLPDRLRRTLLRRLGLKTV